MKNELFFLDSLFMADIKTYIIFIDIVIRLHGKRYNLIISHVLTCNYILCNLSYINFFYPLKSILPN